MTNLAFRRIKLQLSEIIAHVCKPAASPV